jgi:von Willebrand factor A domain-containing protein 8
MAIGAPVPPYTGFPLDPPFRSRFQARYIDPISASESLGQYSIPVTQLDSLDLLQKLRDIVASTQYASESRQGLESISRFPLPPFPQTSRMKLECLIEAFPPPSKLNSCQLTRLMLSIHPALIHSSFEAWAVLSRLLEDAGLDQLTGLDPDLEDDPTGGFFGYTVTSIERQSAETAKITFTGAQTITHLVSCGSEPLRELYSHDSAVVFSPRFTSQLVSMLQVHALGWDISLLPPASPSASSSSTTSLVDTFRVVLGYRTETLHLYKEIGGRELIMRRHIKEGGSTSWEPRYVLSSLHPSFSLVP